MADSYRQAVKENRMVSGQEATVRQLLGCTILALTSGWLYYKGPAGMSGAALSFFYASGMTFLLSGLFNQCGCALRLRWAVQPGQLFKDRSFTPPEHLQFIRGKRRGILANFAASNLFSVGFGTIVYTLSGIMSQQRFNALFMGSLCHICIMVFFSLRS